MATIVFGAVAGNWTDDTKWIGAAKPTAADDVQFNSLSANITIDAGAVARSVDFSGGLLSNYTGTVTHTAAVTLTLGDATAGLTNVAMRMVGGMVYSLGDVATSAISFVSTSTTQQTITSATKTFGNITFNGAGGKWALTDRLVTGATATVTLTAGTLETDGTSDISGLTHSIGLLAASNANARVLNLGKSIITLSGVGTVFTVATTTNLTLTQGTSKLILSDISASTKTFAGGGKSFYDIQITGGGSGAVIFTGANTFNTLKVIGGTKSITLPGSTTTTLLNDSGLGNGTSVITFIASAGSTTIASNNVEDVSWDYVNLTNIIASGTSGFFAGANSTDGGGNTGWEFLSSIEELLNGGTRIKLPRGTTIHNICMWVDNGGVTFTDRITKTSYTPTTLDVGPYIHDAKSLLFDGGSAILTCGDRSISNTKQVNAVSFWAKPSGTAGYFIDLNGTASVGMTANAITTAGWTSPTVYVNGVATSSITSAVWSFVTVTSATALNASAVVLGKIGASFYSGYLSNIILYNKQLTAIDHGWMYNGSK